MTSLLLLLAFVCIVAQAYQLRHLQRRIANHESVTLRLLRLLDNLLPLNHKS